MNQDSVVQSLYFAVPGCSGNEPLNYKKSFEKFEILANKINNYYKSKTFIPLTVYEVASGYIDIANEAMCRPIRSLTQSRGYDTSKHLLTCFGGAGGQHACGIARKLGISKCFIHRHAGILSAIGLQYADVIYEKQISANLMYTFDNFKSTINSELKSLHKILIQEMSYDGYVEYKTEFGFVLDKKKILVVDIKLKILIKENKNETTFINCLNHENYKKIEKQVFYNKKFWTTNIHFLNHLKCDEKVFGPAIIIVDTNTIFVEPNCVALVLENSNILLDIDSNVKDELIENINPIELSIFSHRFMSIAEQMGQYRIFNKYLVHFRVLQKTCVSTNIKERYDFSCAIFDLNANLVANAPHIPVHLGAMKSTLDFQIEKFKKNGKSISAILCNHPSYGGSHLPDFTVLSPVYINGNSLPSFYVANRAHHADIGGITPGSMPPNSHYLWEEGAQFESFNLVENDVFNEQDLILKLKEPAKYPKSFGSRCIDDNINDLKSQIAANNKDNAETSVKKMFRDIIEIAPKKNVNCCAYEFTGKEYMDDGSVIELNVKMDKKNNTAIFDFSKCSDNIYGNTNTPAAVTNAAIIYCLRVLIQKDIPLNSVKILFLKIIKRPNSILYPNKQLAVVGGNVLTSQRIVDVIFKAFQLVSPAASQGCMNNITFGDESFGYYETVGGGTGAGKHWDGADAVHSHMTNTRLTDPEILEHRYPVILKECSIRSKSGGLGKHNGGEGISRTYLFRKNLLLSVLTERRVFRPYGLYGGEDGQLGVNSLIRNGERINLTSKNTIKIQPNDIFELKTPGGGGYGRII
ncbi:5-OPase [Intoshia linei]|uniref:5-OPase n=1 Tax=Intoshia linei TaxID=1819745 RepID=A0A177B585_9BILA|nr:5-OPase [Intoshia linei]